LLAKDAAVAARSVGLDPHHYLAQARAPALALT
jgi:hypothetical protein